MGRKPACDMTTENQEEVALGSDPHGRLPGRREVAQSCSTLCDPMDCSPPGSSVHGTFQARVLEWVAIAFSWMRWTINWAGCASLGRDEGEGGYRKFSR